MQEEATLSPVPTPARPKSALPPVPWGTCHRATDAAALVGWRQEHVVAPTGS